MWGAPHPDRLIILNERHLHRVLSAYVAFFNRRRPHQGGIQRRDLLGGIIHDYERLAA